MSKTLKQKLVRDCLHMQTRDFVRMREQAKGELEADRLADDEGAAQRIADNEYVLQSIASIIGKENEPTA